MVGKDNRLTTLRGRDFFLKESRTELLVGENKRDKVVEALRTIVRRTRTVGR
jgi:uncharacterized protein YaaQ